MEWPKSVEKAENGGRAKTFAPPPLKKKSITERKRAAESGCDQWENMPPRKFRLGVNPRNSKFPGERVVSFKSPKPKIAGGIRPPPPTSK